MIGLEYISLQKNVSQKEIAEKLGLTTPNVNNWITGDRKIPTKHLPELSEMFDNITPEYLQKEITPVDELNIKIFFCYDHQEITYLKLELKKVAMLQMLNSKVEAIIQSQDNTKVQIMNAVLDYLIDDKVCQEGVFVSDKLISFYKGFERLISNV